MKEYVEEIKINDGDLMHFITEALANRKHSDGTPVFDIEIYPPNPEFDMNRGREVMREEFRIKIFRNVKI